MCRQDHVDAADAAGELAVDVEAVMRKQHDQRGAFLARLLDVELEIVLADAERPVRNHPARIGDWRVGQGLADDRDLDAAALDHRHGVERRLVPLGVAHVLRQERELELPDQFFHALGAERELPVPDHRVRLEQRHAVDHVLALAGERRVAVLPGVAAVEEHDAVAALGADRLQDRGNAIEAAKTAVAAGQRLKIVRGQRIGGGRARLDIIEIEKGLAGDMRDEPLDLADAEVRRRLAEQQRHELGMDVRDMNQRDVAERIEPQQLVLRQALLCQRPCPPARNNRRRRRRHLEKIAPRKHLKLPRSRIADRACREARVPRSGAGD